MLLKLILTEKKRFFYNIKIKNEKNFYLATAPYPKNQKQEKRLALFLAPFDKNIIYPCGFYKKNFPAPYPAFELHCKALLSDFIKRCKRMRPNLAVIKPDELIKNKFYLDLSEYVGRIVIISKSVDNELKNALLSHNGTVVDFLLAYEKNQSNTEYLFMPKKDNFSPFENI